MMIRGVIFDMDGLMFDTERLACWSIEIVGQEMGIDILRRLPDLMGVCAHEARIVYEEVFGKDFDYIGYRARRLELVTEYLNQNGIPKKPGLDALLEYLRTRNIPIALATSSDQGIAEDYLRRAGVREYFRALVGGDMVERSKPDPEIFLKAAELLHTKPEETLVLEDSYNGIRAACAGGFPGCFIPDLQKPTEEMERLAVRQFTNLEEVIPFLAQQ